MTRFAFALAATVSGLLFLLVACSDSDSTSEPDIGECPDLTGEWHSSEFVVLTVADDGSHEELTGVTSSLEITEQEGCHFAAVNKWQSDDRSGTEYAAGVLNPDGNWVTVMEVGDHGEGGTTGRILGRLLENGHLSFEYAAYADDGTRAQVFSTILAPEGEAIEPETCPDMIGTWKGYPFDVLNVYADGTTDQQTETSNVLEVEHQLGCTFRGTNTWMRGDLGGSEHVDGVLHSDGVLVSILEVGPHPEAGTRAYVQGRLTDANTMEWDYAGISDNAQKGQGFSTMLRRDGEPVAREACPNLVGKWSIDEWDGFRVHDNGSHESISSDFHDFEVREQIGCTLMATSTYAPLDGDGQEWTEHWVGVINAEEDLLVMRAVAAPSDRLASLLFARIDSDSELHAEYSGFSEDGTAALVYLQRLVKE